MSVRVVLRENNIAVHQMMVPRKTPFISVPFLKAIRASELSLDALTVNDWQKTLDEDFISTKEYDFSYQEGDTLFYDLIIRKESKKKPKFCGCRCDEKDDKHECSCRHSCICRCGKRKREGSKKMKEDCCDEKVGQITKYVLLGFKAYPQTPVIINSWTGQVRNEGEKLALQRAISAKEEYVQLKILAVDKDFRTAYLKDVCFTVPAKVIATLC